MNVIYWGEPDFSETDDSPDFAYELEQPFADDHRLDLQLQLVSDTVGGGADEEAFVSRWLAERQCSGL